MSLEKSELKLQCQKIASQIKACEPQAGFFENSQSGMYPNCFIGKKLKILRKVSELLRRRKKTEMFRFTKIFS